MSAQATKSVPANGHLQIVTDELAQLGRQFREMADEQLPRIAEAAQRTGHSVARASSAAGRSAAEQLRTLKPVIGETTASLRKSAALGVALRFAARRPMLVVTGGLIVAGAGLALLRMARSSTEAAPEEAKSPASKARKRRS